MPAPLVALPWFATVIAGVLTYIVAHLAARVLLGLGIGIVSYVGTALVLDYMVSNIVEGFNGLPLQVLQFAALIKFDVACNIIFGAINARLGLLSFDGILRRFQITGAPSEP
jgi:hypothetical protein